MTECTDGEFNSGEPQRYTTYCVIKNGKRELIELDTESGIETKISVPLV